MAEYEIPTSSSLVFAASANAWNSMVKIDGTHVIVAYAGVSSDGFIETFSFDSKGRTVTSLNQLEFSTVDTIHCSLALIDSTHFFLSYSDTASGDGFIKTFSIDGSFVISLVDTFEFETADGAWTSSIVLSATTAAVAYAGTTDDGFIKTFSFDSGTADNITLVDTLEHETTGPVSYNSLALIKDDTLFALAFTGVDGDGFLKTFTVDTGTADTIAEVDSLEHDTVGALWNSLVKIDETHVALAYTSPTNEGFMKTFSFTTAGATITLVDSLNYETDNANHNSLVLIDSTHLIVAHSKGLKGHVQTLSMDSNFDNIANIDDWEHDASLGNHNSMVKISDVLYMLAYTDTSNVGTLISIPLFPADCVARVRRLRGFVVGA